MEKLFDWKIWGLGLLMVAVFASCKPEFDRIRSSGDVEMMLKKAHEYYAADEFQKAQGLYELLIPSLRGREELEQVYYNYSYTFYNMERFILANYYFTNFSSTFSNSPLREDADFMAAYANYQMSPTFRLEQSSTQKAIEAFELFVNTYPNSERIGQCNRLIDELRLKLELKAFNAAKLYYDLQQYQAAMQSFNNVIIEFPDTPNGEKIRFLIVKSAYELAKNSVYSKRQERFEEAEETAQEFLNKYAKSQYMDEVTRIMKEAAAFGEES